MDIAQLGVTREAAGGALRVNLYSPSTTRIGDATVILTGDFPVADRVTAMVDAKTPQTVKFRLPPWSKTTVFRRLPDGAETSVASGDWHTVQVPAGVTAITVKFDMKPRLEDSDRAPSDDRTDYRYGRRDTLSVALNGSWGVGAFSDDVTVIITSCVITPYYGVSAFFAAIQSPDVLKSILLQRAGEKDSSFYGSYSPLS